MTRQKIPSFRLAIAAATLAVLLPQAADAVLRHSGDSTIQGGLCVGFDCSGNEPMGFATIKIEENNLRIAAADSSTVSGFPTTDWQIEFNSSSSGGGNYFMVRDCGSGGAAGSVDSTCGGTPMLTIEGGADNESIHVDSSGNQGGNVGFGTANPVVDLHVLSGNTPTLRLEQDNSSGFSPQSWDVAGNESNFFIRDVTNGSALPIRIEPGTASNTLYLDNLERIGIGTTAPAATLHVENTTGDDVDDFVFTAEGKLGVGTTAPAQELEIRDTDDANANASFRLATGSHQWDFAVLNANGDFIFSKVGTGNTEMRLNASGDLTLFGNCSDAAGGGGCTPDYVFEPDYELPTLDELAQFIALNKHLPNVPSAADNEKRGVALRGLSFAMLEKIEELVLYTLQQQETIDSQTATIDSQTAAIASQTAAIASLAARLAALEEANQQR